MPVKPPNAPLMQAMPGPRAHGPGIVMSGPSGDRWRHGAATGHRAGQLASFHSQKFHRNVGDSGASLTPETALEL